MRIWIVSLLFVLAFAAHAEQSWLPSPVLPDGLGVNIHFTDPQPGEMKMLAGAGFTCGCAWTSPGAGRNAKRENTISALTTVC